MALHLPCRPCPDGVAGHLMTCLACSAYPAIDLRAAFSGSSLTPKAARPPFIWTHVVNSMRRLPKYLQIQRVTPDQRPIGCRVQGVFELIGDYNELRGAACTPLR